MATCTNCGRETCPLLTDDGRTRGMYDASCLDCERTAHARTREQLAALTARRESPAPGIVEALTPEERATVDEARRIFAGNPLGPVAELLTIIDCLAPAPAEQGGNP